MPKKERRRKPRSTSPSRPRAAASDPRSAIDSLLDEFVICRRSAVPFEKAVAEADHIEPLLVLAAGAEGDPTAIRWTEGQIRHLLLELVPRHQWQPRVMLFAQIAALGEFFEILYDSVHLREHLHLPDPHPGQGRRRGPSGGIVRAALTYWSVLSAVLRNRPASGHR